MSIPNIERAEVPPEKITDYLLRPDHPEGAAKARFFLARGFSTNEGEVFTRAIVDQARGKIAIEIKGDFGTKYVIEGPISCPDGSRPRIRTVWMVAHGTENPRLVTAHPLG